MSNEQEEPPPDRGAPPPDWAGPPPAWATPPPGAGRSDETLWAVLSHLSFFVLALVAPLIIMQTVGKSSAYVRHHAVEALNFHITFFIAMFVSAILVIVLIGIPMLIAGGITGLVFTILAAVAAGRGEWYRYPVALRLVH